MADLLPSQFDNVTSVIRDPLHFKYKLDIGEDAFQSLRLKKYLLDAVDAGNGAIVGFGAAKSSLVASTFFAPTGFLGAIGVGTAATPLGWAIAAGVMGAGLSLVIGKHLVRGNSSKVRGIPDYINTPLDVLAVGLFDLLGMLGVKLALVDGHLHDAERDRLKVYFVDEWGYEEAFVDAGLATLEAAADEHSIREVAEQLAQFKKQNPDCNYKTMSAEIVGFLKELSEVDGTVDEREVLAIEKIESVFEDVNSLNWKGLVADTYDAAKDAAKDVGAKAADGITTTAQKARSTAAKALDASPLPFKNGEKDN